MTGAAVTSSNEIRSRRPRWRAEYWCGLANWLREELEERALRSDVIDDAVSEAMLSVMDLMRRLSKDRLATGRPFERLHSTPLEESPQGLSKPIPSVCPT